MDCLRSGRGTDVETTIRAAKSGGAGRRPVGGDEARAPVDGKTVETRTAGTCLLGAVPELRLGAPRTVAFDWPTLRWDPPTDRPVYPPDLLGSMYDLMGIDNNATLPHPMGQVARVTGTVSEFQGQTQISVGNTDVVACGNGYLSGGRYRGLASGASLVLVKCGQVRRVAHDDIQIGLDWVATVPPTVSVP